MNKNNNFDFLRFLFAVLVVISHAYPLSGVHESEQWIYKITNGQIICAQIGLSGFFVISGFFIFQSMQRSTSLFEYYKKRVLRLFPALFFLLLLTLILAPFVYEGDVNILQNKAFYTYLPNNMSLYNFQSSISGIFDTNHYHAINGSLWSIRYEFFLYVGLSILFFLKNKKRLISILLIVSFLCSSILFQFFMARFSGSSILGMQGWDILNLGNFFLFGSLLASFKFEQLKNKKTVLAVFVLIFLVSLYFNFYNEIKHVVLSIIILLVGYIPIKWIKDFRKIGDMSYGIYIYSFPVQQTLMYYFMLNTKALIFYSLIISMFLGYLSWHLIEKKALKYKNSNNLLKTARVSLLSK